MREAIDDRTAGQADRLQRVPQPKKKIADIPDQVYRGADDTAVVEVGGDGTASAAGGEPGRRVAVNSRADTRHAAR